MVDRRWRQGGDVREVAAPRWRGECPVIGDLPVERNGENLSSKARSMSVRAALRATALAMVAGMLAWNADPVVAFNLKSHKFHLPSCIHAIRCTENCITVRRSEALRRGGKACKVCGGGLRIAEPIDAARIKVPRIPALSAPWPR